MDADRFDALSRALSSPGSRRTTLSALLGALLGSALPVLIPDALAERKGKGKRQRHATRKDRQRATESEGGEVRARDVSAAGHCLAPGQKKCFAGTDCCSGRCKKKKKKCLGCLSGTEYCAAQEACVAPGTCVTSCNTGTADCDGDGVCETNTTTSTQHCGGCDQPCDNNETCVSSSCTSGETCTTNNDCCPEDIPTCHSNGPNSAFRICDGGVCRCHANGLPHYCNKRPVAIADCHQCCVDGDCATVFPNRPDIVCRSNGTCGCPDGSQPCFDAQLGKTVCKEAPNGVCP
jgi:hypothetical protein